jgi:hypothetical protein
MTPSTLAVLRLTTNSNFVGCSTANSTGFATFRILSANVAVSLLVSSTLGTHR